MPETRVIYNYAVRFDDGKNEIFSAQQLFTEWGEEEITIISLFSRGGAAGRAAVSARHHTKI